MGSRGGGGGGGGAKTFAKLYNGRFDCRQNKSKWWTVFKDLFMSFKKPI